MSFEKLPLHRPQEQVTGEAQELSETEKVQLARDLLAPPYWDDMQFYYAGRLFAENGAKEEGMTVGEQLETERRTHGFAPGVMGLFYAGLGEAEKAIGVIQERGIASEDEYAGYISNALQHRSPIGETIDAQTILQRSMELVKRRKQQFPD